MCPLSVFSADFILTSLNQRNKVYVFSLCCRTWWSETFGCQIVLHMSLIDQPCPSNSYVVFDWVSCLLTLGIVAYGSKSLYKFVNCEG